MFEQPAAGDAQRLVVVLVRVIDDLFDAALDDGLGALVAGEQRHIHPRALEVAVGRVEDGVQLRMADIHVFGLQRVALPLPGHVVVVAADRHAVVAQRQDLVFRADDAGPHLAVAVLRPHGREQRDAHKVFVPADIVLAFHVTRPFRRCLAAPRRGCGKTDTVSLRTLYSLCRPGARLFGGQVGRMQRILPQEFLPRRLAAAQVAFGLVFLQDLLHLPPQGGGLPPQPGLVLPHGAFAHAENGPRWPAPSRRCARYTARSPPRVRLRRPSSCTPLPAGRAAPAAGPPCAAAPAASAGFCHTVCGAGQGIERARGKGKKTVKNI